MRQNDVNDFLDQNLRRMGRRLAEAAGPTPELLQRCARELDRPPLGRWRSVMTTYKRPVLFSTMGLAAGIALLVGVVWPQAGPTVHAADVARSLARQSEQEPVLEVELSSLHIDEVEVEGSLQLGRSGIAGDVRVVVHEGEGPLHVDAALALTEKGGWVLLRKLSIPDAEAQMIVNLLMPAGTETLLLLPQNSEIGEAIGEGISEALEHLQSRELIAVFEALIQSSDEYGVTVQHMRDGTVQLTLPIENEEALEALGGLIENLESDNDTEEKAEADHAAKSQKVKKVTKSMKRRSPAEETAKTRTKKSAEGGELIGATLSAIYDPATETVQRVQITGLGEGKGSITVRLRDGDIDPRLLDSARAVKPGTRTIDLGSLEKLLDGIGRSGE